MKISKSLKAFIDEASKTDSYWVESAKLKFAFDLESQLRRAKMTYSSLAQKLGTSAAYITKVFRGDANMTIESMVKLAKATGGQLDIRIIESVSTTAKWDISQLPKNNILITETATATARVYSFPNSPVNNSWLDSKQQKTA